MTVNAQGELITASGAVALPQASLPKFPLFSFQHPTAVLRTSVPSKGDIEQVLAGLLFSADGYLSVMPDLTGLGSSPGLHPYLVANVSASAVIDMLEAVVQWSTTQPWGASNEVYLAGYSSGGYTVLAAHQELEKNYADLFTVAASAPMAGPYDLDGTILQLMLLEHPYPQPYFLPYMLLSYNDVYDLYTEPSDFLAPPYDTTLPPLFDGMHSGKEINDAMPKIPIHILRHDLRQEIAQDPNHPLVQRLQENDVTNWIPKSPVHLYHCAADELVPLANSQIAASMFGKTATLVDPSPHSGHVECASFAIAHSRAWFNSMATAKK